VVLEADWPRYTSMVITNVHQNQPDQIHELHATLALGGRVSALVRRLEGRLVYTANNSMSSNMDAFFV
jgi:hypothetical protein